jgi:hypothetical protein
MNVHVPKNMVEYLMVGMPPKTLVQHSKESTDYYVTNKLKAQKVATTTLNALRHPGMCNVRVKIQCKLEKDQNNQLMHKGRDYHLVSFDLL